MEWLFALAGALGAGAYTYRHPTTIFNRMLYGRLYASGFRTRRLALPSGPVRCWVGGDGPPLVFVHGFGTEAAVNWHAQLPQARRQHRVIAPDLPGFGASPAIDGTHTVALHVESIRQVLDTLGHQRVRLVGHSMGGWISLAFAAEYPDRVARLVLVDAAGLRFEPDMSFRTVLLPECVDDVRRLIAANFERPPRLPRFVLRDVMRVCQRATHRERILEALVYGDEFLDDRLASVSAPTLIMWGRSDALVPLALGERLAAGVPNADLLVFDGCAHSPNVEDPRRFNRALFEFLSRDIPARDPVHASHAANG